MAKLKLGLGGADLPQLEHAEPLGGGVYVLTFKEGHDIHSKNVRLGDLSDEERKELAKFFISRG